MNSYNFQLAKCVLAVIGAFPRDSILGHFTVIQSIEFNQNLKF